MRVRFVLRMKTWGVGKSCFPSIQKVHMHNGTDNPYNILLGVYTTLRTIANGRNVVEFEAHKERLSTIKIVNLL